MPAGMHSDDENPIALTIGLSAHTAAELKPGATVSRMAPRAGVLQLFIFELCAATHRGDSGGVGVSPR